MESRNFPDPEGLFNVEVPSNWLAETGGQRGLRVSFVSPVESAFRPNVNIGIEHVPPLTQEECILLNRLQLKRLSLSEELDRDELLDSGVHIFEWVNQQAPVPVWVRQQVVFAKNKAFTLTATCHVEQCDDLLETFDSILNSFKVNHSNF